MRRTMLFLPGNTPNMLINGDTLGADTIIFDLEDAVSPDEKDAARILVRNALRYQSYRFFHPCYVRRQDAPPHESKAPTTQLRMPIRMKRQQ